MKIYNTETRALEELKTIKEGEVKMYSCGPTVYGRQHIGNYRAFIFDDLLRRTLLANGYKVEAVMNITDVGHLVGDGDEGEDKLQKKANEEKKTAWDISKEYTELFFHDLKEYGIEPFDHYPKATDFIEEQIQLVKDLEEKGFTYKTSDGIYFDTSKDENYGRLSGQKQEDKEEGARIGVNAEKRNPSDFALWKFSPAGEQRHMEWESPWGIGFPGWHLECSVMSEHILGTPFDIHTGGVDHVAVHHANEMAQTECARGHKLANYWMHNGFVNIDGGKMSKSLGNVYTIPDLEDRGFTGLDYRYFTLMSHYRSPLNFTWAALEGAKNSLNKICVRISELEDGGQISQEYYNSFLEKMNDDLNSAEGLAVLWELLKDDEISSADKKTTALKMDEILGLRLSECSIQEVETPAEVEELLVARKVAREEKNWEESDRLRDQISELGFEVKDEADGQRVHKL